MSFSKLSRQFFILAYLLISTVRGFSQDADTNLYAVGVIQEFDPWCDCSNDAPLMAYAKVNFKYGENNELVCKINRDSLDILIALDNKLYNQNSDKIPYEFTDSDKLSLDGIYIDSYIANIIFDSYMRYDLYFSEFEFNEYSQTIETSDPCNTIIGINREGYTMSTTLVVDDPVSLYLEDENPRYSAEDGSVQLEVGDFYQNGMDEAPYLQVAPEDGTSDWHTLSGINVVPNSTIALDYEDCAGEKSDPSSNYFLWLGKSLKFRVVKTLINSLLSVGDQVGGVSFYPDGIEFEIEHTERSYCEEELEIFVVLEDLSDEKYMDFSPEDNFYWSISGNSTLFKCFMSLEEAPNIYKLAPDADDLPVNPFNTENSVEWSLQLIDTSDAESNAFEQSFTIPEKPPGISISQKDSLFLINGTYYDVPDANDIYATLDINDSWEDSFNRIPYKILKDGIEVMSLDSLPASYTDLTSIEKVEVDSIFEQEFQKMIDKESNQYRTYFTKNLDEWRLVNKYGFPITSVGAKWIKYSPLGDYYIYVTDDESAGQIHKVKTHQHWVDDGDMIISNYTDVPPAITPDGKTLVYNNYLSGEKTIYKAELKEGEITNGYMLSPSFMKRNNYVSTLDGNYTMVFKDTSGYGWDMVNLSNDSITNIYPDPKNFPKSEFHPYLYEDFIFASNEDVMAYVNLANLKEDGTIAYGAGYANQHYISSVSHAGVISRHFWDEDTESSKQLHWIEGSEDHRYEVGFAMTMGVGDFSPDRRKTLIYTDYVSSLDRNLLRIWRGFPSIDSRYTINWICDATDVAVSKDNHCFLFVNRADSNKVYKQYHSSSLAYLDFYPNIGDAKEWYDTFKEEYKKDWLNKYLGVKLRNGVTPNEDLIFELEDGHGCRYSFPVHVKVPQNPSIKETVYKNPSTLCAKDGSAYLIYSGGGIPPYTTDFGTLSAIGDTIIMTDVQYGENIISFSDTNYNISASIKFDLIADGENGIWSIDSTAQTCNTPNGTISIRVGGLGDTIEYKVINESNYKEVTSLSESNKFTFTGLSEGYYTVEASSESCTFTKEHIEIESNIFKINSIEPSDVDLIGNTGDVSITFKNRTGNVDWISGAPLVFNPSEDKDSVFYSGIIPGTYSFVAEHTDIYDSVCSVSDSFSIKSPEFDVTIKQSENDEEVLIQTILNNGNEGITPYKFMLLNQVGDVLTESSENENLFTEIQTSGNYSVQLQYGAERIELYTFSFPTTAIVSNTDIESPECPGDYGIISFSPEGGIDNTDLMISADGLNYFTTGEVSPVEAGTFRYFIKDENNSTIDIYGNSVNISRELVNKFEAEISDPDKVSAQRVVPIDVTCAGSDNGEISISGLKGGSGSYEYKVDSGAWFDTTEVITGLSVGNHEVYLRDKVNTCPTEQIRTIEINEPDSLLFEKLEINQTTCSSNNGSIAVQLSGGTLPYSYEWTNFSGEVISTDSIIDSLSQSGYYILDVMDQLGCTQHFEQAINPSDGPIIDSVATKSTLCYGDSNGEAWVVSITDSEPFSPWTLLWSDGETLDYTSGLAEGLHSVSVTDTNACIYTAYFEVESPDSLCAEIETFQLPQCYGYTNGLIEVNALGGVGDYNYEWSNGDRTYVANSLHKGVYSLVLSDSNGCKWEKDYELSEPESLIVDLGEDITMCPGNQVTIDGKDFAQHIWSNQAGYYSPERFVSIDSNTELYLEVVDSNGCYAWDTLEVAIGSDALQADFLMISEADIYDTIWIYEISNMALDSMQWTYNEQDFVSINTSETPDYMLLLEGNQMGIYNIGLQAYSGGCVSEVFKQVEVVETNDTIDGDNFLGYTDPLITSFVVSPNPNEGNFTASIELREEADIKLVVFSINYGLTIDERLDYGLDNYSLEYTLDGISSGVYVIMLNAGDERKQVKMIVE